MKLLSVMRRLDGIALQDLPFVLPRPPAAVGAYVAALGAYVNFSTRVKVNFSTKV